SIGKDDKFATPREAAQRLHELRQLEAETALKARTDAAREYAHDTTIGLSSEQIAAEFQRDKPDWVKTDQDVELWKATERQQGNLPLVAAIEKFQENFEFIRQHEDREAMAAAKEQQQAPQPEPAPQPQPQQPPPTPQVEQLRLTELIGNQLLQNGVAQFQQK